MTTLSTSDQNRAKFIVWLRHFAPDVYRTYAKPVYAQTSERINGLGRLGGFADVMKNIIGGATSIVNSVVQNAPAIATAYNQTQAQLAQAKLIKTNADRAKNGQPPIDEFGNPYSAGFYDTASGFFGNISPAVWIGGAALLGLLILRKR